MRQRKKYGWPVIGNLPITGATGPSKFRIMTQKERIENATTKQAVVFIWIYSWVINNGNVFGFIYGYFRIVFYKR